MTSFLVSGLSVMEFLPSVELSARGMDCLKSFVEGFFKVIGGLRVNGLSSGLGSLAGV